MKKQLLSVLALAAIGLSVHAQTTISNVNQTKTDTVIRSLPSPLPAPPFPSSDWVGSPLVGVDATAPNYPLTKLLGLSKSKVKIYGWVDVGGNISSSKNSNAPTSYDLIPNSVVLDQVGLKFDKQPILPKQIISTGAFFQLPYLVPITGILQVKVSSVINCLSIITNMDLTRPNYTEYYISLKWLMV